MASKIQEMINRHKKEVVEMNNWAQPTDQQKANSKRLEKISQLFMTMILYLNVDDDFIPKITERWIACKVEQLLERQSKRKKVAPQFLKQIIGVFLRQQFEGHGDIYQIKQQFSVHYQDSFMDYHSILMIKQEEEQDKIDFIDFVNNISAEQSTISDKLKIQPFHEIQTYGNNVHEMQVIKYLMELGAPQSQLLYLCQFMSWKNNTREIQDGSKYRVEIEVQVDYKKYKATILQSHLAKNKKTGKIGASFKVLRKIYVKYPEIWHLFNNHKQERSIKIQKDPHNPIKLMVSQLMTEQIKVQNMVQMEDDKKTKQRQDYLAGIANYKTQMNYVLQQNPQVLTHPKMIKAQDGKNWKVKGQLIINSKSKKVDHYEQIVLMVNSKAAEQEIAKLLIKKLYQNYHDILQRMIFFKQKKFSK